jgi:hypothetical protein
MGFCNNCGEKIEAGTKFCENCGAPVDEQPVSPSPQAPVSQVTPATEPPEKPNSLPIPQMLIVAGIVVVVIIIALVFASGVMSKPPDRVTPPTITVTPTKQIAITSTSTPKATGVSSKDPLIGVWRNPNDGGLEVIFRFNADGSTVGSGYNLSNMETVVNYGTWKASGDGIYNFTFTTGNRAGTSYNLILDPARNVIYEQRSPSKLFYPYEGDTRPASSAPVNIPSVSSGNTPKYVAGDIVGLKSGDEIGDLIINYTQQTDRYSVQTVHLNNGEWQYLSWSPETYGRSFEESYDPIMLGHINPESAKKWT